MAYDTEYNRELRAQIAAGEVDIEGALHRMAGYAESNAIYQHCYAERIMTTLIEDWEAFDAGVSPIHSLAILVRDYEKTHDWGNDEDPDATGIMITECRQVVDRVQTILGQQRQAAQGRE